MGIDLFTEVLFHAPEDLTPAERVVLLVIAEEANDGTRRGWPGRDALMHRSGLGKTGLARVFARLAERNLEVRLAVGTDSKGQPVYAFRGQQTQFQMPRLCPLPKHDRQGCRKGGLAATHSQVEATPEPVEAPIVAPKSERVAQEPPIALEREAPRPPIDAERMASGPPIPEQRVAPGPPINPKRVAGEQERVAPRPPLPLSPLKEPSPQTGAVASDWIPPTLISHQPTPNRWEAVDEQPRPAVGANKPHAHRQSALFAKVQHNLPQAVQIVFDGLKAAGYPNATADDARAVHKAVAAQYGPKVTLNYLRTMAGNRSFVSFFEAIKASRAEEVEAKVRDLQRAHPDCEHGTAAGRAEHPTTGELMCPWCRSGTDRPAEIKERTHPAVAAALATYRQETTRRLTVADLMRLTQEAKALYERGCTAEQLVDYARAAAQTNTGLLHAAAVK